jgi:hypothetical protein
MGVNIEKPDFDEPRDHDGFRALRAHQIVNRTDEIERDYYDGESPPA